MRKFYESKEFKALHKFWMQELKTRTDFKDIEDSNENLKQHDRRTIAFDNRQVIEEFFLKLDSYLTNTKGIPPKHRKVLELYSQGVHVKGKKGISKRTRIPVRTINSWLKKYKELIKSLP